MFAAVADIQSPMIARFCVTLQLRRVEAMTSKRGVVLSPDIWQPYLQRMNRWRKTRYSWRRNKAALAGCLRVERRERQRNAADEVPSAIAAGQKIGHAAAAC